MFTVRCEIRNMILGILTTVTVKQCDKKKIYNEIKVSSVVIIIKKKLPPTHTITGRALIVSCCCSPLLGGLES